MRLIYLSFFVFVLFVSPVFSGPEEEKLRRECLKPTVCIWSPSGNTAGTAFVVRSERVGNKYHNVAITANHCMTCDEYLINVPFYGDRGELLSQKDYLAYLYAGREASNRVRTRRRCKTGRGKNYWSFFQNSVRFQRIYSN